MLRHRGSLDNSHKDIYSFTAPCANPRLFLHWSLSPTAHIRLCVQAEVHCDRGVSWEIRQIKVHPGVGWRFYSGRNQFLDNKYLTAPDQLCRTGEAGTPFLWSTQIYNPDCTTSLNCINFTHTTPCVWPKSMYISTPHGPQERDCGDIMTISITNCFLLIPTVPEFSWRNGRDSIVIPPILCDCLPTVGFDCIRFCTFSPLVMSWDVCAFVRTMVNTAAYKIRDSFVKRGHGCHIWGRLYTDLSRLWDRIPRKHHLPSHMFGGVLLPS